MVRKYLGKRRIRVLAASFTVAPPAGTRIRDRLCLSERVRIGMVPARQNRRSERKKALTKHSSSRWAGAITRASEDQYRLALRVLCDEGAMLTRAVRTLRRRLAVPCAQRQNGVRGYADAGERWHKRQRLDVLAARLAEVEHRLESGHPAIVVGGKSLAKAPRGGAPSIGADPFKTRLRPSLRGTMPRRWRSDGAPWGAGSGVGPRRAHDRRIVCAEPKA